MWLVKAFLIFFGITGELSAPFIEGRCELDRKKITTLKTYLVERLRAGENQKKPIDTNLIDVKAGKRIVSKKNHSTSQVVQSKINDLLQSSHARVQDETSIVYQSI